MSLERYIVINLSRAVRYIAVAVYRKNDISLRRYIARTIYRLDIKEKRRYLVELSMQRIAYMCDISLRYHRYIARTNSDIQRLSFALLLHNTVRSRCQNRLLSHPSASVSWVTSRILF